MSTTAVSIREYLHTDYSPDVDYVDGELEDRNVGEWDHGRLQGLISAYLLSREPEWKIIGGTDIRVQVSPTRFRVPDVVVVTERPSGGVITAAPLLCIEILSPEDKLMRVRRKINDYLSMGVAYVWIIDPEDRRGEIWAAEGARTVVDGVFTAGPIRVPLDELGR